MADHATPDTQMPQRQPDCVIAGAGVIGAAAALALRQHRRALWLRPSPTAPTPLPDDYASRVYALSPGNLAWLETLGIAPHLDRQRVGSVRAMEIRTRQGGRLDLTAQQAGVPEIALIIEGEHLQRALESAWAAAGASDTIIATVAAPTGNDARLDLSTGKDHSTPAERCSVACASRDTDPSNLHLRLDDGSCLTTRLLVAADGATSPIREAAGIDCTRHDYGHRAIVANFRCERPHRGIACQWFDKGAVLAWLPLPGHHISMVWSLPAERAHALLALSADALTAQVEAAGDHRWGGLTLVSVPQSFPLRRLRARTLTGTRLALVGDAAHVVHPLAGQGMNLGLRDVRALVDAIGTRRDPGNALSLARYQALRQFDVHSIEAVTDGLFRLFGAPFGGALGGHGMGLLNHLAPLKSEMIRLAMR